MNSATFLNTGNGSAYLVPNHYVEPIGSLMNQEFPDHRIEPLAGISLPWVSDLSRVGWDKNLILNRSLGANMVGLG